jgi:uncharacterized protein
MSEYLWKTYHRLVQELDITSYRYLYDGFDLKSRLTGVIGPRGVGKTTLLLQIIKNHWYDSGEAFYFSADNTFFSEVSLLAFVDELYQEKGVRIVFIDEIHKYPNWNQELKNIYDSFPRMKVVFSGSSSMDLVHGSYDLSRRAKLIYMPGLSFREYLNMTTGNDFPAVTLDELLANHIQLSAQLAKVGKLLERFEAYQKGGYYPFALDHDDGLYETISTIVEKTVYEDIANFYQLKTNNLKHFRRIINFLATIPPGKVNISNTARHLGVDYKTVDNYVDILEKTGLVKVLYPVARGNQVLTKADKMYLDNSTLLAAVNAFLSTDLEMGTQRELFFLQSVSGAGLSVFHPQKGDFFIRDITFEVGGKNKTISQLKDIDPARRILVKDGILTGSKKEVPLHLFGFLY